MAVRERLGEAVRQSGLTNVELGRRMNPKRNAHWVGDRLLGERRLKVEDVEAFADALGLPVGILFQEPLRYEQRPGQQNVAEVAQPYLKGWEWMREIDRQLFLDVVEAFARWRTRSISRRQQTA